MPHLKKTLIVPDGDPEPVFASDVIKFVVIGDRPGLVGMADDLAVSSPFTERTVVWFVNSLPAYYANLFNINQNDVKAFVLSAESTVRARMFTDDAEDYVRIDQMYHQAGQSFDI